MPLNRMPLNRMKLLDASRLGIAKARARNDPHMLVIIYYPLDCADYTMSNKTWQCWERSDIEETENVTTGQTTG
jgi:hypothetical protein